MSGDSIRDRSIDTYDRTHCVRPPSRKSTTLAPSGFNISGMWRSCSPYAPITAGLPQMPRDKLFQDFHSMTDAKGCVTPPDEREPELLADRGSAQSFSVRPQTRAADPREFFRYK